MILREWALGGGEKWSGIETPGSRTPRWSRYNKDCSASGERERENKRRHCFLSQYLRRAAM